MKLEIVEDCCGYARKLVAEGCDPEEILEFYRGDMLCLRGKAKTFARLMVSENSKSGPVHVPWKPFPVTAMRPRIELNEGAATPMRGD